MLLFWLQQPVTLISVVGPAIGFGVGLLLVPAWRSMVPKLLLVALAAWPLSHALSWWDAEGLHVVPVAVAGFLAMVVAGQLEVRRQWFPLAFGVWASTLMPDVSGVWLAHGSTSYVAPVWYWGIGGYGLFDALVVYPVSMVLLLGFGEAVLRRRWLHVGARLKALSSGRALLLNRCMDAVLLVSTFVIAFGSTSIAWASIRERSAGYDEPSVTRSWSKAPGGAYLADLQGMASLATTELSAPVLEGRIRVGLVNEAAQKQERHIAYAQMRPVPGQDGKLACFLSFSADRADYVDWIVNTSAAGGFRNDLSAKALDGLVHMVALHEGSHCEGQSIFRSGSHPLVVSLDAERRLTRLSRALSEGVSEERFKASRAKLAAHDPGHVCLSGSVDADAAVLENFNERFADLRGMLLLARLHASDLSTWREMMAAYKALRAGEAREVRGTCLFNNHDSLHALELLEVRVEEYAGPAGPGLDALMGPLEGDSPQITRLAAGLALDSMLAK